ncbi:MAG: response regulator [Cyanobacteria bacterium]|nr:response regulator [Cyanobacteriota bacterium]MDW8201500.1 response regulator [Cyanobacteriota bacterium SKYGB_h_bin112]
MQGKLTEIDIRSILQLIELGQRTGELFVESYSHQPLGVPPYPSRELRSTRLSIERSWFVFFLNGEIIYAAQADGSLTRLRDYLYCYGLADRAKDLEVLSSGSSISSVIAPEYGYLWALLENYSLSPAQGRAIVQSMVQETLFDLLSLHQGSFIFELGSALAPQLTTFAIEPLVADSVKQIQAWKQLHPYVQSPDQWVSTVDGTRLATVLPENSIRRAITSQDAPLSVRQIARRSGMQVIEVGRLLYPYIQQGTIQLSHPIHRGHDDTVASKLDVSGVGQLSVGKSWQQPVRAPRVVCIDDGLAVRTSIESILSQNGYEVATIGNPVKALSLLFQLKPDLILCDIAMPDLDGYEICAMLRRSIMFRQIPIVMLTGKDGFIDRVKARMVGATDYLTKPFGKSELLMLVEKYVGLGDPNRPKPNELLADALRDELGGELDTKVTESA